jgi:hypothetical protein
MFLLITLLLLERVVGAESVEAAVGREDFGLLSRQLVEEVPLNLL